MGKISNAINDVTVKVDSSANPSAKRIKDALKELVLAFDSTATPAGGTAALIEQIADVYSSGGGGGGSFDLSQAEGVLFSGSTATEIDLSGLNTSHFTTMMSMFANCSNLTAIDVSGFDTSNVVNFNGMFNGCSSLKELDISNFDMDNMTMINSFIANCTSLEKFVTGAKWRQVGTAKSKFPVAMTDETGKEYSTSDVIPNGEHTYTATAASNG